LTVRVSFCQNLGVMAASKTKHPGGRPAGPAMPCGWGCGANLTAVQIREHFTNCPRRPTDSTAAVSVRIEPPDPETRAFLKNLRKEITRRRKENHAQKQQRIWNVENILKLELIDLLDWIEDELDKVK
jgi:hypothetical protein